MYRHVHHLYYYVRCPIESRIVFSADDFIQKLVPTVEDLTQAWASRPSVPPPIPAPEQGLAATEELALSPVHLEPPVDPASTSAANQPPAPTKQCLIMEQPILCDSFVGIPQIVHNQSFLGFFRERGGISY